MRRPRRHVRATGARPSALAREGQGGRRLLVALFALWLSAGTGRAEEVEFTAGMESSTVGLSEQANLVITLSVSDLNQVTDLRLPQTGTFQLVGRNQTQSMSVSISNAGQRTIQTQNIILTLQPTQLGVTTIGQASMSYKGQRYTTKPITVQVIKAPAQRPQKRPAPGGGSPFGIADDDLFRSPFDDLFNRREQVSEGDLIVRAQVSPERIYEGQQATVSLVILTRIGARLTGIHWPKLDDFIAINRDVSAASAQQQVVNGVPYSAKVMDQKALFPLRPGEFTLGPIEVEIDPSSFFARGRSRTFRSAPVKIHVTELPEPGRPQGFHRANVGQFELDASVDQKDIGLNQPVTYTLVVRGTGNLEAIRPPELGDLPRFKRFDPTVEVRLAKQAGEIKGTKTVETILVPLASGELTIPGQTFHYFDPEREQYRTLTTEPITLQVKATQGGQPSAQAGNGAGREVNLLSSAFKPIRFVSVLSGTGKPFRDTLWFWPLVAFPPGLYLGVLLFLAVRSRLLRDSPESRMRKASARSLQELKKAQRLLADGKVADFYAALKVALLDGLESKLGLPPHGLTLEELKADMHKAGLSAGLGDSFTSEIENCDFGRFAPSSSQGAQMQDSLDRVRRLLKALSREQARPLQEEP